MATVIAARKTALARRRCIPTTTVVLRVHRSGTGNGSEDRQGKGG